MQGLKKGQPKFFWRAVAFTAFFGRYGSVKNNLYFIRATTPLRNPCMVIIFLFITILPSNIAFPFDGEILWFIAPTRTLGTSDCVDMKGKNPSL